MMWEARLEMSLDKLRAPGGVQVACFRRGGAYGRGRCPGPLHRVAAAVCARAEALSPPWESPPPKSPKIAENPHIFVQILAAAPPKAATAAARAQAAAATPGEGARALPPCTSAPRPNKCALAFKAKDL
jgi:hypothetical protein